MDMKLAALVRQCVFDFDAIAVELGKLMEAGDMGEQAKRNVSLLNSEACRKRWSQLDASQWAQVDPTHSVYEPLYKVCIASAVLGNGHGAQPSFQTLSALAAGSLPSYLAVPTKFPSVSEMVESDDDDDDEDPENHDMNKPDVQEEKAEKLPSSSSSSPSSAKKIRSIGQRVALGGGGGGGGGRYRGRERPGVFLQLYYHYSRCDSGSC